MAEQKKSNDVKQAEHDANKDPLSGRAGSHPVGTGIGAVAGGAAAGAAVGSVAGPVGTAIGTAAGAVIGGLAGKGIAESVDPTVEHGFWRENYAERPYADKNKTYEEYAPAYQYGWESQAKNPGRTFEESEPTMKQDWENNRGKSTLSWDRARDAARDSWTRVSNRSAGGRGSV